MIKIGTSDRLRFYLYCDLSTMTIDYGPSTEDYPEYPLEIRYLIHKDTYKSIFGSNYWDYIRGTSMYWTTTWKDVSDACIATLDYIVASSALLAPHVVIWKGPNADSVPLANLMSASSSQLMGTFRVDMDEWAPKETMYGLWDAEIIWRLES